MKRTIKSYLGVTLRGLAMGAADVVPGVSGGTIAFITGIYEEFLNSLKSINLDVVKTLKSDGIANAWKQINGNFLVALFAGIGISIISLAKGISFLLKTYPILLWAFFFGLIIASSIVIAKKITKWSAGTIISLTVGAAIAFYITVATPAQTPEATWFVFLSGMVAICAMILPGISGSFILLLMGKYAFIINSLSTFNIKVIITFALGCIAGLLSFSHVLSWMFKKYYNLTIALLTGFMIGSLNKVWPWKLTTQWRTNSHGEQVPFLQESILPSAHEGEALLLPAILLAVVGFILIIVMEKFSKQEA